VLRDTLEPPINDPETTILHNNIRKAECVTNRLLYQLSYVGFWLDCPSMTVPV
jgi:hypothetical protein